MALKSGLKIRTLTYPVRIGYVLEYSGKMVNMICLDGKHCSVEKKLVKPFKRINK